MALDHYPPLALSGAFFPVIASLIAGLVIILRIMMENKYGMIFTSIMGNYTLDNLTSFPGKITWDLIGNISWDETRWLALCASGRADTAVTYRSRVRSDLGLACHRGGTQRDDTLGGSGPARCNYGSGY